MSMTIIKSSNFGIGVHGDKLPGKSSLAGDDTGVVAGVSLGEMVGVRCAAR